MRTTIEIPDEQRGKLLEIAARRGDKGFSRLVQEALAQYLDGIARQEERIAAALETLGTIADDAADDMEATHGELRASWR